MKKITILLTVYMILFINHTNSQIWKTYTTGLARNDVYAIAIDAYGNKWFGFGFEGGGVTKFDDNTWTTYPIKESPSLGSVCAIVIDAEGNKWCARLGGGVSILVDTTWITYTTEDGLAHNEVHVTAIDSDGNKWIGTYGGVSKFDDTTWTTYDTLDGLVSND